MAEMPKEKARSVRDPFGEWSEAVQRKERLKRERAEDAAALKRSHQLAAFRLPFEQRSASLDLTSPVQPTVTYGRQRYREVDNGIAGVLVPVDDPLVTPAIRAARREAIERAFFSAAHPVGGALDGGAAFLGVPEKARDPLLYGGAVLDALADGFAPRGGAQPTAKPSTPRPTVRREVDAGAVRYGKLKPTGQATGVNATVRKEMLRTGTTADPRIVTPGLKGAVKADRAHLLAKLLGGRGEIPENLVTASHLPTNDSFMKRFENGVAKMVRGGEYVHYSATPIYGREALPPRFIMMTARGSNGSQMARIVENPAGRPK
jgi:hypothetical protein